MVWVGNAGPLFHIHTVPEVRHTPFSDPENTADHANVILVANAPVGFCTYAR